MITVATIYHADDMDKLKAYANPSVPKNVKRVLLQTVASSGDRVRLEKSPESNDNIIHGTWYYDEFSFAAARNAAISLCETEWVLMLDADESLHDLNFSGVDFEKIPSSVGGVLVNNVLLQMSRDGKAVTPNTVTQTRIFRNRPEFRYKNRCHEQILQSITSAGLQIMESDIVIVHHGYRTDDAGLVRKFQRNIGLMLKDLADKNAKKDVSNYKYLSEKLFHTYRDLEALGGEVL